MIRKDKCNHSALVADMKNDNKEALGNVLSILEKSDKQLGAPFL